MGFTLWHLVDENENPKMDQKALARSEVSVSGTKEQIHSTGGPSSTVQHLNFCYQGMLYYCRRWVSWWQIFYVQCVSQQKIVKVWKRSVGRTSNNAGRKS